MLFDVLPGDSRTTDDALDPYSARVATAFERVSPAVAHITAIDPEGRSRGIGSGVVFTPDGYLLTNNHVVAGAARLVASMPDGHQIEAMPVGYDPATDLPCCGSLRVVCPLPNSAARRAARRPTRRRDRQPARLSGHRHGRHRQRSRAQPPQPVGAAHRQRPTPQSRQFRRSFG
jgi:hypothetical protein